MAQRWLDRPAVTQISAGSQPARREADVELKGPDACFRARPPQGVLAGFDLDEDSVADLLAVEPTTTRRSRTWNTPN